MSKSNFIVSYTKELWINECRNIFIAEPHVFYKLDKNNELSGYSSVKVAPYLRRSRENLINDSRFVDDKYELYLNILSVRLNSIHCANHSKMFWKKALGTSFIRYITTVYGIYKICESYFNQAQHDCNILSEGSYFTPLDFEDQRICLSGSEFGQEQIFSIYMNLFYPNQFKSKIEHFVLNHKNEGLIGENGHNLRQKIKHLQFYKWLFNKLNSRNNIEVGILGCFFSAENKSILISKSNKKIFTLDWWILLRHQQSKLDNTKRNYLSHSEDVFDKFDKFFFASIKFCMPRVFIEYYNEIETTYKKRTENYPNLKYVISETWLSNTYASLMLAFLHESKVKHIYNEHNCLWHPIAGDFFKQVLSIVDIYATIGWDNPLIPKLVKASSLFPFVIKPSQDKKYKMLFIGCPALVKTAYLFSIGGVYEENIPKLIGFISRFFENLSLSTLKEITYRRYPENVVSHCLSIDKEYLLKEYLRHVRLAPLTDAKTQMSESRLVIVDYISTSYIESMCSNIPTIFFWDREENYLNDEYVDFYNLLVEVGICQTDPVHAAVFIEQIKDNPEEWWFSESVQAAKNAFIDKNIGKPETFIDYLVSLVN